MSELLLRALGARDAESGDIVGIGLRVQPAADWLIVGLLAVIMVIAAWWSYRPGGEELTRGRRHCLLALRIALLLLFVGLLLRPTLVLTVEGLVRQTLLLLFDESASMALRDPRR